MDSSIEDCYSIRILYNVLSNLYLQYIFIKEIGVTEAVFKNKQ